MNRAHVALAAIAAVLFSCGSASAQFADNFDGPAVDKDWAFFAGDGVAAMQFVQRDGYASILVDSTKDRRGIWWALIKRNVAGALDLSLLEKPGFAIRVEARIRASDAPRRVNLSLNTQRTTDFHRDLMEFDIPDSKGWHTISFTDATLGARPGDTVNTQLALMDWGLGKYRVDIDYYRVDMVEVSKAGPDKGVAVPYRPPVRNPAEFSEKAPVSQDSTVDLTFPDVNLNTWHVREEGRETPLLAVNGNQWVILRWDLSAWRGKQAEGSGLLELTTYSVANPSTGMRDFGGVRVTEILGGDPAWDQKSVTLETLTGGKPLDEVINPQMIIDVEVAEDTLPVERGSKVLVTISRPVLQRLLDGRTNGITLKPLGAINASFYASEHEHGRLAATLLFNVRR
jgi:hypothetical protein